MTGEAAPSLVFDDLPNGIIVVEDGAGVIAANAAMLSMLACERDWLIGQPLSAVLTRPAAMRYHASFYVQLRGVGHVTETCLDFKTRAGADVPVLCTAKLQVQGTRRLVVISATHMTERRRLEEDLLRTRRITELIPGVVYQYVMRADGGRAMPYASEALHQMFGIAPSDVVQDAAPLLARVHPDDLPGVSAGGLASATGLQPWRQQFRARRTPTADYRWLEGTANPERLPDGATLWHGFIQDINDRKVVEDARREKESADRANRAKNDFLARVSHELRTPLNAILGFTQVLALDAKSPLQPSQRRRVQHIDEAGRDLLHLIDEVTDITRIESGVMRLQPEPIPLRALLTRIARLVEEPARRKGVRLIVQAADDLHLHADPARLAQVLTNLLSNAVKYNRDSGTVTASGVLERDRAVITIEDTGPGLSEEQIDHLFEPFNRLGAEHSSVQGTGLGLVIVKRLVESMEGTVVVSSQPGQGTAFRVLLPRASSVEDRLPGAAPAQAPPGRLEVQPLRVLYVEDNPVNALVMQAICELHAGLALHIESTGAAALAWVGGNPVDLLLIDMNLPDFDGVALLPALRLACGNPQLAAIAVSADALPEYLETARLAGFNQYWTKPLDVGLTLRRLEALLNAPTRRSGLV